MSVLTPTQDRIAATIIAVGQRLGATAKQIQAALATGWVESQFQNLPYGMDGDNKGVFQQRTNWGSIADRMNVEKAAAMFYTEARRVDNPRLSAGQLAQAVQQSGYPQRYAAAMPFINSLFGSIKGGVESAVDSGAAAIGSGVRAVRQMVPVSPTLQRFVILGVSLVLITVAANRLIGGR